MAGEKPSPSQVREAGRKPVQGGEAGAFVQKLICAWSREKKKILFPSHLYDYFGLFIAGGETSSFPLLPGNGKSAGSFLLEEKLSRRSQQAHLAMLPGPLSALAAVLPAEPVLSPRVSKHCRELFEAGDMYEGKGGPILQ